MAEHSSKLDQIRKLREARVLKAERAAAEAATNEKRSDLEKVAPHK
jgi:hypothetical protein